MQQQNIQEHKGNMACIQKEGLHRAIAYPPVIIKLFLIKGLEVHLIIGSKGKVNNILLVWKIGWKFRQIKWIKEMKNVELKEKKSKANFHWN